MTVEPTEEAARALDYGLARSSLSLAGQLAYDRMVAAEKAYRAPGPTREENMRAELDAELARMGWSETTHTLLPVAQDGEQPQDAVPGLPRDGEAELDAGRLPVQNQPAKVPPIPEAISRLITIACPILGAGSAGIGITYQVSHHKLAGHLTGLSTAAGIVVMILTIFNCGSY